MARATLKAGMPDLIIPFAIQQSDLIGNLDPDFVIPQDGVLTEIGITVDKAITTGGTFVVKTGDALATTVALQDQSGKVASNALTIPNAATKGTRYTLQTKEKDASANVTKGMRMAFDLTSFATAGALTGYYKISAADTAGVMPFKGLLD